MNVNYLSVGARWGSWSPEYQLVYNAMTTKPSFANSSYFNEMVDALYTAGFWARMDLLYFFAGQYNANSEALINWKNPGTYNADDPTTVPWTQYRGYAPNGTDDYLSTNFNLFSDGVNFVLDSGSIGVYVMNNILEATPIFDCDDTTNHVTLIPRYSEGTDICNSAINSASAITTSKISNTDSRGLYIVTRTASNSITCYKRGLVSWDDTEADVSNGVPNAELLLFHDTQLANFGEYETALFFIMDSVSAGDVTTLSAIFNNCMASLGTNVY